jgi:glycine/D-amino acid oxidase-like deaminating enzyme
LARAAVARGAELRTGVRVERIVRGGDGRATGVETSAGTIAAGDHDRVGGVWTPELLATAGLRVPVTPRKGQIVVLERSPVVFRRKLSEAGYVAAVEADDAALQIAMVVESTPSGTALLGSSRQHVGFDREVEIPVAAAIARRAARFFPVLAHARALRVYAGLRPLTPDHVPIIGPFADAPNICVATGHEGAGIGLAPATAELVTAWYTRTPTPFPLAWFSPDRFAPVELAAP